ncbi:hypothetical protein SLEP1_g47788 [Rubroshorea leprosula]|uniref:Reverse transcriptase domain-containing protein n=1 Tax=Rubroshorea leprosula TaxID=152421 RepID=A0AAV5LRL9_9ROSI|nr:hypothetical protein SLEP1_g47788 [Rubroshorea leprosula]
MVNQSISEDEEMEYWSTDHCSENGFDGSSHEFRQCFYPQVFKNVGGDEDADVEARRVMENELASDYEDIRRGISKGLVEECNHEPFDNSQYVCMEDTTKIVEESVEGLLYDNSELAAGSRGQNNNHLGLPSCRSNLNSGGELGPINGVGLGPSMGLRHDQGDSDSAQGGLNDHSYPSPLTRPENIWRTGARKVRENERKTKEEQEEEVKILQVTLSRHSQHKGTGGEERETWSAKEDIDYGATTGKFFPNPDKPVSGELISDGAIVNCNRGVATISRLYLAEEIWQCAKKVRVVAVGNEQEVSNAWRIGIKQLCFRGWRRARREFRDLVRKEKVDFLAIQETKSETVDWRLCIALWGSNDIDFVAQSSRGQSGGLVCTWDKNVSRNCSVLEGENFIGVSGLWVEEGDVRPGTGGSSIDWEKIYLVSVNGAAMCRLDRQHLKEINSIQINGQQLVGVHEIKEGVAEYFQSLISEENCERPVLEGAAVKHISSERSSMLTAPFSLEEEDVVGFVQEFHENEKLVAGSNSSFITLIPKTSNLQMIEEYRSISLIGVTYKVVTKLLANRLQLVMPAIIGDHQLAFAEGRQLMEAVVMTNEIIYGAKRCKSASFIFKIDFEKAYNKVTWSFLDYMMRRMGFNETWRASIRECLSTSRFSVLFNGSPTREFVGLNGLIHSAVEKMMLQGIEIGSNGAEFCHIQFVDYTILFGKATKSNVPVGDNHRRLENWLPLVDYFKKKSPASKGSSCGEVVKRLGKSIGLDGRGEELYNQRNGLVARWTMALEPKMEAGAAVLGTN